MAEQFVRVDFIDDNPYQKFGRIDYGDIADFARGIATYDLIEKPSGRMKDGRCELRVGHRRKEAFLWLNINWKKEGLPNRYEGYSVMPIDIQAFTDQEMLDCVVVENEHRKGLTDIERANLMVAYREETKRISGKDVTSDQIALAFNIKSGATVRGIIRLLDLKPKYQGLLQAGKITQGMARAVLTMQRFLNDKDIDDAIKEMQTNNDTPETVLEQALDMADVFSMNEHSEVLKTKTFKHLPPLLFDKSFGVKSQDFLDVRERLDSKGAVAQNENEKTILHLLQPPACSACEHSAKVRNFTYCPIKLCYERKEASVRMDQLIALGKRLGIAIYDEAKDGDAMVLSSNDESRALFRKKQHCRLKLNADKHRTNYLLGEEGVTLLFLKSGLRASKQKVDDTQVKAEQAGEEQKQREKEALKYARRALAEKAVLKFSVDVVAPTFAPMLDGITGLEFLDRLYEAVNPSYWQNQNNSENWEKFKKASKNEKLSLLRAGIVWKAVYGELDWNDKEKFYYAKQPICALAKHCEGMARTWGLKLSKTWEKYVQEAQAAFDAAVVAETAKGKVAK